METEELDAALDELEVRLERLRALYDQYFLGIEKLEPLIARKDVDRRIYVLRREKIRNTGRRFKFQTLIQRYNTFQQYWQRVLREIENGTYRRHVLRAERTVGPSELLTVAARRRFGRERSRKPGETDEQDAQRAVASIPPESQRPVVAQAPLEASKPPLTQTQPLPVVPEPEPPRARAATQRPAKPIPSARPFESLELDMDFMGDWDPAAAAPPPAAPPPAAPPPVAPAAPPPAAPPPVPPPPKTRPLNVAPPNPGRRLAPPPKPGVPAARPAPEPPTAPVAPAAPVAPRAPVEAPRGPATPPAETAGAAEPRPRRRQRSTHPGLGPVPAGAPAPPAPAATRPATGSSTLSEDRLRTLHAKLLEESRRANAPGVSLESMAKSLRAVEARLRTQHGSGRRIEFEVIVRDGKPAIKPIVR